VISSLRWRLRLRAVAGDEGVALVMVLMVIILASSVALAAGAYAISTQKFSKNNQGWNAALAAAQAGVDDYISHLNANDNYARTWDCTNAALVGPNATGNTCGWTTSTVAGFSPVTTGDTTGAAFHYDVSAANLDSRGLVQVTSTGRVNGVSRTLQVSISRGGSTDFLYYTDHEDADPDNQYVYPTAMPTYCSNYWWTTPVARGTGSGSPSGCQEISFAAGDVLNGPVHTNDTPLMGTGSPRPSFTQGLETSDPACKAAVAGNATSYKYCDRNQANANYGTVGAKWAPVKYLTDTSDQFQNFPGCQFSGSTRIKFNSNGTMTVWSANSTNASGVCGGTAPMGVTMPVPTDQVIYVKAGGTQAQCLSGQIGDGLPLGTYTGNLKTGFTYDQNMTYADQFCGQGNIYIQGTLKGRVTVAASNSIVVTGDLLLAGGKNGTDMLGLVSANSVEVFHPEVDTYACQTYTSPTKKTCATWGYNGSPTEVSGWPARLTDPDTNAVTPASGIQIDASIQTLQHSFFVQSYNQGSYQGALTVFGSIAQKWRGIVGTGGAGGTGYLKSYGYDLRLKFSSPPYFPQWTNAAWGARSTGEISAIKYPTS
jgi:Tfp pilus assembly protein PilX